MMFQSIFFYLCCLALFPQGWATISERIHLGKDRNQRVKLPLIYYLSEQMNVLRPDPKPNRRMMIENDSLYLDSCLVKMTCEALNSLNDIDLNTEEAGVQFTAAEQRPTPSPEEFTSYLQGGSYNYDIDHLLNLDCGEAVHKEEHREESLPNRSYIQDESSSTLFYLRGYERQKQEGIPIFDTGPLEQPTVQGKKTDTKNIPCYISRFVSRAMLNRYEGYLKARCLRAGVSWNQFRQFCNPSKFKGINSLLPFFAPGLNKAERRKKEIFTHLFQKILRRHYLRLIEDQGHMTNRELYIQFKNKQLLYCQSALPS